MKRPTVHVKRIGPTLTADRSRVLLRPFHPTSDELARRLVKRVLDLSDEEVLPLLQSVLDEFTDRHANLERHLRNRFVEVRRHLYGASEPTPAKQLLIGAYFCHEYSLEAAALFNPSIVPHPDQSGLPPGGMRFILSLRATGEGHISSIAFREGIVSAQHRITLKSRPRLVTQPERSPDSAYAKALFARKLDEAGVEHGFCQHVLAQLPEDFALDELRAALAEAYKHSDPADETANRAGRGILLLAESNYEVHFDADTDLGQRVLFPYTSSQSHGIEDARFVRFLDDDGGITHYATYTAYDGRTTLPQLLETRDFVQFKFSTLNGPAVQNKGMALFPRKLAGRYAMLSRQDDENILLMFSDNVRFWQTPTLLLAPAYPWEYLKLGNCGSPIETEAGWLVLTHGVGPMRKYSLGAFLLDLEDPTKIVGRLKAPLLAPNEAERDGYVPNVVYTCGALLHGRELLIPYAMSDFATSFASVSLDELLREMT